MFLLNTGPGQYGGLDVDTKATTVLDDAG